MEHPFLNADPHPQWSQLDPNIIAADIEHAITSAQLSIDILIEKASHSSNLSYESTFQALESALEPLNTAWV